MCIHCLLLECVKSIQYAVQTHQIKGMHSLLYLFSCNSTCSHNVSTEVFEMLIEVFERLSLTVCLCSRANHSALGINSSSCCTKYNIAFILFFVRVNIYNSEDQNKTEVHINILKLHV